MRPVQFRDRHIGPNNEETNLMLQAIGVSTIDELIERTIPDSIRLKEDLDLRPALSEFEYLRELKTIASKNKML